jgi:hypothetical protein
MTLLSRLLARLQPFRVTPAPQRPQPLAPPLAAIPGWLAAHDAEQAERQRHGSVRKHQQAKQDAVHAALADEVWL